VCELFGLSLEQFLSAKVYASPVPEGRSEKGGCDVLRGVKKGLVCDESVAVPPTSRWRPQATRLEALEYHASQPWSVWAVLHCIPLPLGLASPANCLQAGSPSVVCFPSKTCNCVQCVSMTLWCVARPWHAGHVSSVRLGKECEKRFHLGDERKPSKTTSIHE